MQVSNITKAHKFDAICRAIELLDDNNVLDTLDAIKEICTDRQHLTSFDFITDEFCRKPMEETSTYYETSNYDGSKTVGFFFPNKCLELDLKNINSKHVYRLGQKTALLILLMKLIKHGYYKKGMCLPSGEFLMSRLGVSYVTIHSVSEDLGSAGAVKWECPCDYVIDADDGNWMFTGRTLSALACARIDVGNVFNHANVLHREYKCTLLKRREFEKL